MNVYYIVPKFLGQHAMVFCKSALFYRYDALLLFFDQLYISTAQGKLFYFLYILFN